MATWRTALAIVSAAVISAPGCGYLGGGDEEGGSDSEAVADSTCWTGIVVDGAGFASAIVANKVPGILAATCWDLFTVRLAREHVGANVLTLGGKVIGMGLALEMVKVWLETAFAGGRHQRRTDKIRKVEEQYARPSSR